MTTTEDRTVDLLDGYLYAGDPYPTYSWLRQQRPRLLGRDQRDLGHLPLSRRDGRRKECRPLLELPRFTTADRALDVHDQYG